MVRILVRDANPKLFENEVCYGFVDHDRTATCLSPGARSVGTDLVPCASVDIAQTSYR